MKKIKVLIADDHHIVLDGLKSVLSQNEDIEVVATAGTGLEVLDYIESNSHGVDVVILDINMPEMDGITCAKELKKKYKQVKVLILTMYPQKTFVDEFINIGIDGCLLKNHTGVQLVNAIYRVSDGNMFYDHLKEFKDTQEDIQQYKLGNREIEIIQLLCEGHNSQQIADLLFISDHTVKTHRKNILRKLNLHSTAQLVQFAISNQLITTGEL